MENKEVSTAEGPGAIQEAAVAPKPALEGSTEYEFVELFNPLSVDFVGQFGVTRPINAPLRIVTTPNTPTVSNTEDQISANYGVTKNPDHSGKTNIINKVTIKSGRTVRILGSQAQVIVRQLVTLIMQKEGKQLMLADPYQRGLVEERVIRSRGNLTDILEPQSIPQQLEQELKKMEQKDEEFADARSAGSSETSSSSSDGLGEQPKRAVGRPPRTATT